MEEKNDLEAAKAEADRDLAKSIPELVRDFDLEANRALPRGMVQDDTKYILKAQKRMVAMMARVAMENNKVSRWIFLLTLAVCLLTLIQVIPLCKLAMIWIMKHFK